jgi:hypothetical protein
VTVSCCLSTSPAEPARSSMATSGMCCCRVPPILAPTSLQPVRDGQARRAQGVAE